MSPVEAADGCEGRFALTALPAAGAGVDAGESRPAVCFARDTIIDLQNYPARYTSDDEWNKCRGVLLSLEGQRAQATESGG
jgi:hypothetical protein